MTSVPSSPHAMLSLDHLTRRYGSLTAVDDVSMRLPAGARHAVIGTNGAGKTTLLDLIAGTERADHGCIRLAGTDVTRASPAQRSRLGIARSFQQPRVVAELTALDNVVLALWRHHPQRRSAWRRPSRHRRLTDTALSRLDAVGLAEIAHHRAGALSHGQRRMLDLTAALAANPKLLLLDEPAAGLTDDGIDHLLRVLTDLTDEVALLMVEHHTDVVAHLADTVTVLASGRILLTEATRAALDHPEVRDVYRGTDHGTTPGGAPAATTPEKNG
jgi:branched-chain amino acid transport system ATP-binding protein